MLCYDLNKKINVKNIYLDHIKLFDIFIKFSIVS
jgi:hypothetical protein